MAVEVEVKELDGRKWGDNSSGGNARRRFRITGLAVGFAPAWDYDGLPKVGDAHPSIAGYVCTSREFEEGQGKEKISVVVTVTYEPQTTETSGEGEAAVTSQVDEWGWDDGTDEKELTSGVNGTPVLNSAGDPFESVPKILAPSPVFTKSMRFKSRQIGWSDVTCCVNNSEITVGGVTCPVGSLLCTVCERRLIRSEPWKYQYVVKLRYKSNPVRLSGSDSVTDIGWDVAITDAGMRELDDNGGKRLIRATDKETGKPCTVTSVALLDGHGKRLADGNDPINFRYQAYRRASFPSWFYSEPTPQEEGIE